MLPTDLLWGPLLATDQPSALNLTVLLCDLGSRFLSKGRAGKGYRAIARNGRVLLATDRPVAELAGRTARVRLQSWHRVILRGKPPEAYGILLSVRSAESSVLRPSYVTCLTRALDPGCELALDVGGGLVLEFRRIG